MPDLSQRTGERPKTNYGLPHEQLNQNPPADIYKLLKSQAFDFEFVERRPSVISVPGAEALWLLEEGGHSRDAQERSSSKHPTENAGPMSAANALGPARPMWPLLRLWH